MCCWGWMAKLDEFLSKGEAPPKEVLESGQTAARILGRGYVGDTENQPGDPRTILIQGLDDGIRRMLGTPDRDRE
jgi:hypothetical protein